MVLRKGVKRLSILAFSLDLKAVKAGFDPEAESRTRAADVIEIPELFPEAARPVRENRMRREVGIVA